MGYYLILRRERGESTEFGFGGTGEYGILRREEGLRWKKKSQSLGLGEEPYRSY